MTTELKVLDYRQEVRLTEPAQRSNMSALLITTTSVDAKESFAGRGEDGQEIDRMGFEEDDDLEDLRAKAQQNPQPQTEAQQNRLAEFDNFIGSIEFNPTPDNAPTESKSIEVTKEAGDYVLSRLSNTAGTVTEAATIVLETVGKAIPGMAKDTLDAFGGIMDAVRAKPVNEGPVHPEKIKGMAVIRLRQESQQNDQIRVVEQRKEMTSAELVRVLGATPTESIIRRATKANTSIDVTEHLGTPYGIAQVREAAIDEQIEMREAQDNSGPLKSPSLQGTAGYKVSNNATADLDHQGQSNATLTG